MKKSRFTESQIIAIFTRAEQGMKVLGFLLGTACILLTFFLIWAELAVGIFGTPFAGT